MSLYDANKGVWNVHKKLILWCFLHKNIQNRVTGSGTCIYNGSKECSLCSGCFTVFSICVLCLALFPRLIAERLHWAPDSQFCLSTWKCDSAWKYNPVSAELPHWKLAAGFCSAPPGKCLKCATMAKEMLGEAEMTCSFEKRCYRARRDDEWVRSLSTLELGTWSLPSLPLLSGHGKNPWLEWRKPFRSLRPPAAPLSHAHSLSRLTKPACLAKLCCVI